MKNNKDKIIILIGLLVGLIVLGLFFLYGDLIENNGVKNGVVDNNKSELEIEFISDELDTVNSIGYKEANSDISINDTSLNLNVLLRKPGDVIIYSIALVNKGDKTGILSNDNSIIGVTGNSEMLKNIEYSLTYSDGAEIKKGDELLGTNDGEDTIIYLKLIVKYKDDAIKTQNGIDITLRTTLMYEEK